MKISIAEWLNTFDQGEKKFLPVQDQDEANNLVRQITAKSRRRPRTKNWRFVCTTFIAMNVSNVLDQQMVLEVVAIGEPKHVTIN